MEYKDAGQGYISQTSTETGGKEGVMIMDPDKLVGGRVEVASQSPCKRHPLMVERGSGSLMGLVAFLVWAC